jgi:hypothetical protein
MNEQSINTKRQMRYNQPKGADYDGASTAVPNDGYGQETGKEGTT